MNQKFKNIWKLITGNTFMRSKITYFDLDERESPREPMTILVTRYFIYRPFSDIYRVER